jgi:hypothetical protein
MQSQTLSDYEKKEIIKDILGENHNATGKNFPVFSALIDYISMTNDALSFAELIPSLNSLLSGAIASSIVSSASFIGTLLFPIGQLINVANAYQTGHRMYSYRCIAYTITSWSFEKPLTTGSIRVLSNIRSGPVQKNIKVKMEYDQIWHKTLRSVLLKLNQVSDEKGIPKDHMKLIFRALGGGNPQRLCQKILENFEPLFEPSVRNIWKSNYSIKFPH